MNALKNNPRSAAHPEHVLKERLRKIIAADDWIPYRETVNNIASDFELGLLDCAAAMAFLAANPAPDITRQPKPAAAPELKMLRYRLEVGRKHQATEDGIKKLLIEESGVEKRLIGRVDIHNDHTYIQLPDGMPAEIYHHLKDVEFNRQALRIKRLDNSRGNPKSGRNARRKRRPRADGHKESADRQERREISRTQKD